MAAINAATLALVNAGVPMRAFVCACSVGCVDSTPLLDVNYVEKASGGPELLLAAYARSKGVITTKMDSKLPAKHLEEMLELGLKGCRLIHDILKKKVKEYVLFD